MFTIKVAEHVFRIDNKYPFIYIMCERFYTDETPEALISVTEEEMERERGVHFAPYFLEYLAVHRKINEYLFDHGMLLFHGGCVTVDGEAYLFTAPSGTGKTTITKHWRNWLGDSRSFRVSDDKPFLRITDSGVVIYGSPWDGRYLFSANVSAPLKAVCLLEQGETNHIEAITPSEALPELFRQAYRPPDPAGMEKALSMVVKLSGSVKLYRLRCTAEPEAARVAYYGMHEGKETQ